MSTKEHNITRHPIVVIMGHVDHGKTTLLDYIRKTKVASREAGGITQRLSAYEIEWKGKKITFLDTPGHETFSAMRSRGARVADIAVLVVAADDGVKPQTKESIGTITNAKIPFLVAANKIDKSTADIDRTKSGLAEVGVQVEGWGGQVPFIPVSAKEGTGVDDLLETILLLAEIAELRADPSQPASGVVIESHMDSRRGPSATLLITDGTLTKGDFVLADNVFAPVRILEAFDGSPIDTAGPSSPIIIAGFSDIPPIGAPFHAYASKEEVQKNILTREAVLQKQATASEIGIMIKADTAGSYEALVAEIQKSLPQDFAVTFFQGGVGEISENDVKAISGARHAFILGFSVKAKQQARDLAERFNVEIGLFNIIYEAISWAHTNIKELVPKKIMKDPVGKLLVLKTFSSTTAGKLVGGRVREGKIPADALFDIVRQGTHVARGSVISLQRNKTKVTELKGGEEGGLLVQSPRGIEERDVLEFFYEREA